MVQVGPSLGSAAGSAEGLLARLDDVDAQCVQHPLFGDSCRIRARRAAYHGAALEWLDRTAVAESPSAARTAGLRGDPALASIVDDPVIGGLLFNADQRDGAEFPDVVDEAIEVAAAHPSTLPLTAAVRGGEWAAIGSHRIWLWRPGSDRLGAHFDHTASTFLATTSADAELVGGGAEHAAQVVEAASVVSETLPLTGTDALSYLCAIAPIGGQGAVHGATLPTLPGVALINESAFSDTMELAASLFHEALHSKLFAIEATQLLMRAGYDEASSARIQPVWHKPPEEGGQDWPVDRALGAFHVYAHLALLFCGLTRQPDVRDIAKKSFRKTLFRAHFLAARLQDAGATALGPAGRALVNWLAGLLPEPFELSPKGAAALETHPQDFAARDMTSESEGTTSLSPREMFISPLLGGEIWIARARDPRATYVLEPPLALELLRIADERVTSALPMSEVERRAYLASFGLTETMGHGLR